MDKKNIIFVADFFADQIAGGGEICNQEIIKHFHCNQINSHLVSLEFLATNKDKIFLIGNFINLSPECKKELSSGSYQYYIIEHDHKYIKARNPLVYPNLIAPESEIINYEFYKKARTVFAQSNSHSKVIQDNTFIDNIINMDCNLFSKDHLDVLRSKFLESKEKYSKIPKPYKYAIMVSSNKIKGTKQAIEWAKNNKIQDNEINYIDPCEQNKFYDELSKAETFIFFPQTYETYSRVFVEAKSLRTKDNNK